MSSTLSLLVMEGACAAIEAVPTDAAAPMFSRRANASNDRKKRQIDTEIAAS